MENLIEHEGKKYREVPDGKDVHKDPCLKCCFSRPRELTPCISPTGSERLFDCARKGCHFELVGETNPKE